MKKQLYFDIRIFTSQITSSLSWFVFGLLSFFGIGFGAVDGMNLRSIEICSCLDIFFSGLSLLFLFCNISGKRIRRNLYVHIGHPVTIWNFIISKYLLCMGFMALKVLLYAVSCYMGKILFGSHMSEKRFLAWICFCCITTIILFLTFLFFIREKDNFIIAIVISLLNITGEKAFDTQNINTLFNIIGTTALLWLFAAPVSYLFYKKADLK